jgi:hypothetical protein
MFRFWLLLGLLVFGNCTQAQQTDSTIIKQIYEMALSEPKGYEWLEYLCKKIGGRLAGSPEASAAVEFTRQIMDTLGFDRVYLQEVKVPHWVRGKKEQARITHSKRFATLPLRVCAVGNSVGTGEQGIEGQVIEVKSLEEVASLGKARVAGKIIFFNMVMENRYINPFTAYGLAGAGRRGGASEAAKYGAKGVIIRSLTTKIDEFPHTGSLRYALNIPQIPAIALATADAEALSKALKIEPDLQLYFETHCQMLPEKLSYNVIGELKGTEKPEEIVTVGGHLDSWDLGEGAHDDGTGCMQSIEVGRIFKKLNIRPKRTIRIVMFMNEENGLRGGQKYASEAERLKEKQILAFESDAGGFAPKSIGIGDEEQIAQAEKMLKWNTLFRPYGVTLQKNGGGADISPLRPLGAVLSNLQPDANRYFDYHHTTQDTYEAVNMREMQLGAATMTAFIYLVTKYGF